jgi:hypothetical protein
MIAVDWGNDEETLLIWRFVARWRLRDVFKAVKQSRKLTRNANFPINFMVDLRHSRSWDSMMLLLCHAAAIQTGSQVKRVVIISANPIYKQLWKTAQRLYGAIDYPVYFVSTVDDAYSLSGDVV